MVFYFSEIINPNIPLYWDDYFRGSFQIFCCTKNITCNFIAYDHGPYPWGRSNKKGALAALCCLLGINSRSGTFNCCCFIHLLAAILDLKLFKMEFLFRKHAPLLKKYMHSRVQQNYIDVLRLSGTRMAKVFS